MSSSSLDSEMSFDSEDSEINFIRGYEIAAERDVLDGCPQSQFITNFERWRSCWLLMLTTHWRHRMDIELPKARRWRQKTRTKT